MGTYLPFSSMKKQQQSEINYYSFQCSDGKPQSYWTTYLQTPLIGSDAPAQMVILHLLRNQIIH